MANDDGKIKILVLNGARFNRKSIDVGTTVGQFRADNNIAANATMSVDGDDVQNDFVLEADHTVAATVDNKNGGKDVIAL